VAIHKEATSEMPVSKRHNVVISLKVTGFVLRNIISLTNFVSKHLYMAIAYIYIYIYIYIAYRTPLVNKEWNVAGIIASARDEEDINCGAGWGLDYIYMYKSICRPMDVRMGRCSFEC